MSDFSHLPLDERIKQYLALAHEAHLQAARCTGEAKAAFIRFAGQWEQLAREAQDDADKSVT